MHKSTVVSNHCTHTCTCFCQCLILKKIADSAFYKDFILNTGLGSIWILLRSCVTPVLNTQFSVLRFQFSVPSYKFSDEFSILNSKSRSGKTRGKLAPGSKESNMPVIVIPKYAHRFILSRNQPMLGVILPMSCQGNHLYSIFVLPCYFVGTTMNPMSYCD